jgi:hypothetical protein
VRCAAASTAMGDVIISDGCVVVVLTLQWRAWRDWEG